MSEKEYIEKDTLVSAFLKYPLILNHHGDFVAINLDAVLSEIRNATAADVAPVVHGRWVNERILVGGFAEKWGCDCSNCGKTASESFDYYPNCGCKMDGGAGNG